MPVTGVGVQVPPPTHRGEMVSDSQLLSGLDEIVMNLSNGGEVRTGQKEMAVEINRNLREKNCLTVEAGTGIGKSLAYLLPYVFARERVIVATNTKALQDQLIDNDLPLIANYIRRNESRTLNFQIAKGWSNYLCNLNLKRLGDEIREGQMTFDLPGIKVSIQRILDWIDDNPSQTSREDINFGIDDKTWQEVSMTAQDCLRTECPFWEDCYPRKARDKIRNADVIVTNHHLYAYHMKHNFLGHIGRVVIDEAHQAEEAFSGALSIELSPGRFNWLARHSKKILSYSENGVNVEEIETELKNAGKQLEAAFKNYEPRRIHSGEAAQINTLLSGIIPKVERLLAAVKEIDLRLEADGNDPIYLRLKIEQRRISNAAKTLLDDAVTVLRATGGTVSDEFVVYIDQTDTGKNSLVVSPLSIKRELSEHWLGEGNPEFGSGEQVSKSVVLTSATIPSDLAERMGLPASRSNGVAFSSPFDYKSNALLYCPEICNPALDEEIWETEMLDELVNLLKVSHGRTLALFTSKKMLNKAFQYVGQETGLKVLKQGDRPAKDLLREFRENEEVSLFGTRMFFQGVDIPGSSLSLVVINRLPFPAPTEHLIRAWADQEDAKGMEGFRKVLLPICRVRLAQAGGRLIRRKSDSGVVAVLDPRLAETDYGSFLLKNFPPMKRTRKFSEVSDFFDSQ